MTTASTAVDRARTAERSVGFGATLASEWTKISSLRSTYIMLGLALVLSIGMTALIAAVIGNTWSGLTAEQQADFDPVMTTFFGSIFSGIILSVLGVTAVSSEYSSGMIRTTLTATPRRGRVLIAKALIIGVITLVVGTVSTVGMFLVGQAIFGGYGIESASLTDGDALRTVIGVSIGSPIFPLIGAALAVMLRSTAGAITTVMGIIFAPAIFGGLLPAWWQENILRFLPGPASDNLAQITEPDALLYMAPAAAAAVVVAWIALFLGAAYLMLTKRDV